VVAGVAVSVAFFVLFAAMSAGLSGFIDEELGKARALHLYLEADPVDPYEDDDIRYIQLLVDQAMEDASTGRWTLPRVELRVTTAGGEDPVRLWGVGTDPATGATTPPYDRGTALAWGRHLETADFNASSGRLPCVLGARALDTLFPGISEGDDISIGPDGTVDPWWMPDAADYPLKGKATVDAPPRGPVAARAVGALKPGQEGDVDWGIFVPVRPLLRALGQYDAGTDSYRYPMAIVSIEDGSSVDVMPLEAVIAEQLPGTSGTDDAWDRTAFEASYGATGRALDGWLAIVSTVLVVLLVAGVSDTTLVAVAERRREIATLRAVGLSRRQVSRLVTGEVLALAAIGLAVGLMVGATLAMVFGHLHEATGGEGVFLAPVSLGPWVVAGAAVLALGAATLAAAYPARRAAKGSPTEALRYE
jgi:hypothetical protein